MNIQQALKDGYSHEDIMGELSKRGVVMDYKKAIADGFDEMDVLSEMNSRETDVSEIQQPSMTPITTGEADVAGLAQAEEQAEITQAEDVQSRSPEGILSKTARIERERLTEQFGMVETAGALATGAVAAPLSYGAEVLTSPFVGPERAEEIGQSIAKVLTYKPQTEYAKSTISTLGKVATPFTWPGKTGGWIGKKIDESLGNEQPIWEKGLKNVADAPLQALGIKIGLQQANLLKKYPTVNKIKSVDADIDKKISNVIQDKFYHAIRPSGKKSFKELKEFHTRTGKAERWLAENKQHLQYEDIFTGEVTSGHLPKTAIQNAQAFEQGLKILWKRADDLMKDYQGHRILVDKRKVIESLANTAKKSGVRTGAGVRNELLKRIDDIKADITENGNFMTLDDVMSDIGKINERSGGKLTAQLSDYSGLKADFAQAQTLRKILYDNIDGVQELRSLMSDFKTAEPYIAKAAARRMNIDPEKMDFLDIGAITAGAHGLASVATGGGATSALKSVAISGTIAVLNRMRKHGKDIDIQTNQMYKAIDKIVEPSRELGSVLGAGGSGLPRQGPMALLEHKVSTPPPPIGKSGIVRETTNVPPLAKPTTRALPYRKSQKFKVEGRKGEMKPTQEAMDIIYQNMQDENYVKAARAVFNNPSFWKKNQDLVDTIIRLKNNQTIPKADIDKLMYRIHGDLPKTLDPSFHRRVISKLPETFPKKERGKIKGLIQQNLRKKQPPPEEGYYDY